MGAAPAPPQHQWLAPWAPVQDEVGYQGETILVSALAAAKMLASDTPRLKIRSIVQKGECCFVFDFALFSSTTTFESDQQHAFEWAFFEPATSVLGSRGSKSDARATGSFGVTGSMGVKDASELRRVKHGVRIMMQECEKHFPLFTNCQTLDACKLVYTVSGTHLFWTRKTRLWVHLRSDWDLTSHCTSINEHFWNTQKKLFQFVQLVLFQHWESQDSCRVFWSQGHVKTSVRCCQPQDLGQILLIRLSGQIIKVEEGCQQQLLLDFDQIQRSPVCWGNRILPIFPVNFRIQFGSSGWPKMLSASVSRWDRGVADLKNKDPWSWQGCFPLICTRSWGLTKLSALDPGQILKLTELTKLRGILLVRVVIFKEK